MTTPQAEPREGGGSRDEYRAVCAEVTRNGYLNASWSERARQLLHSLTRDLEAAQNEVRTLKDPNLAVEDDLKLAREAHYRVIDSNIALRAELEAARQQIADLKHELTHVTKLYYESDDARASLAAAERSGELRRELLATSNTHSDLLRESLVTVRRDVFDKLVSFLAALDAATTGQT